MKLCKAGLLVGKFRESPAKLRLAVILGLAGMVLILMSDMLSSDDHDSVGRDNTAAAEQSLEYPSEEYKQQLETELERMLSDIDGVGSCRVMVTLSGSEEKVYAQDFEGERSETAYEEEGNDKKALIKRTVGPEIAGVLVVCRGGGDPQIEERVILAVSRGLGVSAARIYVAPMCG